jgi:hypothetical protein
MKQFLFLVLASLSFMSFHPIYISMAEVEYKEKEKRIEIAVKIFSDDLQKVISRDEGEVVEIATKREHKDANKYIIKYLKKNFKLFTSNEKELEWEYVGRELDKNEAFALWVFMKVDKVKKLKGLKLYNNILIDFKDGQTNKISFRKDKGTYKKFDTYRDQQLIQLF